MSSGAPAAFTRRDVEFPSCGTTLGGHLYLPAEIDGAADDGPGARGPAIAMAPGFGGVKDTNLARYASVFAQAGFVCLAYDNINFGDSGGEPRQEVDWMLQQRGYRDAITFLSLHDRVDEARIGLWGSSYAGAHVLQVSAIDRRVRCVVAQVPAISGLANRRRLPMSARFGISDRKARFGGGAPTVIPGVFQKGSTEVGAMPVEDAAEYLRWQEPSAVYRNEVTLRSVEDVMTFDVTAYLPYISPRPLLMIVADQDALAHADLALDAFQRALEPKELLLVPGTHFTVYGEHFERTSEAARDWFIRHL
jgi:fermentation-respiration switch protein FrsA (DUF1100 family)